MALKVNFKKVLHQLFYTWCVCRGSLVALIVIGSFMPCMWLPFVGLGLMIPVIAYANYNLSRGNFNCSLETQYTVYSLFFSSLIMIVIDILNTKWFHWGIAADMHDPQPFISTLIVYPVSFFFFFIACLVHGHVRRCTNCREQHTFSTKMTVECNVFTRESMQQIHMHAIMSGLLSLVTWCYYAFLYINVNINTPDTFFFFIVPGIVLFLSMTYYALRYSNMHFEASISPQHFDHEDMAKLRFIIVGNDKILLQEVVKEKNGLGIWDTPGILEIPYSQDVTEEEAKSLFINMAGIDNFDMRYLFSISTSKTMTYHYAIFLSAEDSIPGLEGKWFNLYEIDMMMKSGLIARAFAFEMHRIFTITMAWKTYDRNGKRLYPIKNYRPTFRLNDFKDWNVDYSDLHWLSVSQNNEDRPFFRLRRFWRNYISGSDLRWKKKQS